MNSWKIVYYETENGKRPVYDFLDTLNEKFRAKVVDFFDYVEEYGAT